MNKWWEKPFNWLSFAVPAIIALIVAQVFMRYVVGRNIIVLEELQWDLYGLIIIFGIVYTTLNDLNVRMDLFHAKFKPKTQKILKFIEALLFIIPFAIIMLIHGADFALRSFQIGENSINPGGLPYIWIMKAVIPIAMFILLLVGIYQAVVSFLPHREH